jgi:hypothetical protein
VNSYKSKKIILSEYELNVDDTITGSEVLETFGNRTGIQVEDYFSISSEYNDNLYTDSSKKLVGTDFNQFMIMGAFEIHQSHKK